MEPLIAAVAVPPSFPQPEKRMRVGHVEVTEHQVRLLHAPRSLSESFR